MPNNIGRLRKGFVAPISRGYQMDYPRYLSRRVAELTSVQNKLRRLATKLHNYNTIQNHIETAIELTKAEQVRIV